MKHFKPLATALILASSGIFAAAIYAQKAPSTEAPKSNDIQAAKPEYQIEVTTPIRKQFLFMVSREIRQQTPINMSLEVVHQTFSRQDKDVAALFQDFSIPSGQYTIESLLSRLKQKTSTARWLRDEGTVNLIVDLAPKLANPFDAQVKSSGELALTPYQFIEWMDKQSPKALFVTGVDTVGFLERADKIPFRFEKGMTLRQVTNRYVAAAEYSYQADIYYRKVIKSTDGGVDSFLFKGIKDGGVEVEMVFDPTTSGHQEQVKALQKKAKEAAAKVPASSEAKPQTQPG